MAETIHKFPSTPHLAWPGGDNGRDDKVLTPSETRAFLSGPILVEEKIDGANLGISLDQEGRIRFQNRGNWLQGQLTGQWARLRGWMAEHEPQVRKFLPQNHILFGEWCYAMHSIRYDNLPDWFLAFDVYDTNIRRFWSLARRNSLASAANLATVPIVSSGAFTKAEVITLLNSPSAFANGPCEGLYLRQEEGEWLEKRAKIVRSEFTQGIAEHWSRKTIVPNKIREALKTGLPFP